MNVDSPMLDALEPGQLTNATQTKLPRRALGRGAVALLVLLRVYVVIAVPIVVYAFVHALGVQAP